MPSLTGMGGVFDTVSDTYDKFRPAYVPELYRMLLDYIPIGEGCRVVEIGTGSGQATTPLLETGCFLTAVEQGERFSALLREKFGAYEGFSLITAKFEDCTFENNSYDLVFSATAFHWIPEEIGYPKVYAMLKPGGVFARFANHPFRDKGRSELAAEIDGLYREYYYPFYHTKPTEQAEFSQAQARELALLGEKYGFRDSAFALFHRRRCFSAEEYVQLLGTYSDHLAIDEPIRGVFFAKIADAIRRHGGTIEIYDTIDLELVRK